MVAVGHDVTGHAEPLQAETTAVLILYHKAEPVICPTKTPVPVEVMTLNAGGKVLMVLGTPRTYRVMSAQSIGTELGVDTNLGDGDRSS